MQDLKNIERSKLSLLKEANNYAGTKVPVYYKYYIQLTQQQNLLNQISKSNITQCMLAVEAFFYQNRKLLASDLNPFKANKAEDYTLQGTEKLWSFYLAKREDITSKAKYNPNTGCYEVIVTIQMTVNQSRYSNAIDTAAKAANKFNGSKSLLDRNAANITSAGGKGQVF